MEGPEEAENRAATGSCSPQTGHIPREKHGSKGYMHPHVHCSDGYISQDMDTN